MDFGLSAEQQMIVDTVRSFVETEIYPHEAAVEKTGIVPPDLAADLRAKVLEMGFGPATFRPRSGAGALTIWSSRWSSGNWGAVRWR